MSSAVQVMLTSEPSLVAGAATLLREALQVPPPPPPHRLLYNIRDPCLRTYTIISQPSRFIGVLVPYPGGVRRPLHVLAMLSPPSQATT